MLTRSCSGKLMLTRCPCGADLSDTEASHHIYDEHLPEDFGLSPLRQEADPR